MWIDRWMMGIFGAAAAVGLVALIFGGVYMGLVAVADHSERQACRAADAAGISRIDTPTGSC